MDKSRLTITPLLTMALLFGFLLFSLPSTYLPAAVNETSVYTVIISTKPMLEIVGVIMGIIASIITIFEFAKNKYESRRWRDVVIK